MEYLLVAQNAKSISTISTAMELSLKPLHLFEVNSVGSPCLLLYLAIYCLQLHIHNATSNHIIQVFIDSAS